MPGFNINTFRTNGLPSGGARPTQFAVSLTFPNVVDDPEVKNRAPFTIKATMLPASIIPPVEVGYFGRKIKFAGDRVFQDWTVTVMNDEDFALKNAFEQWHNAINAIVGNTMDPAVASIVPAIGSSYKVDALVTQFAKTGPGDIDGEGAIKTYKFNGLFPISVDEIQVGWEMTDQIEEFNVTFAYDWWEPQVRGNDEPQFPLE